MSTNENRKSPATWIAGIIISAVGLGLVGINAYNLYHGGCFPI